MIYIVQLNSFDSSYSSQRTKLINSVFKLQYTYGHWKSLLKTAFIRLTRHTLGFERFHLHIIYIAIKS